MSLTQEIAAAAARWVVEEGMEYGAAKHKAARALGRTHARSGELPSNDEVEEAVREYLSIFCADSQPRELAALRAVAARWMQRLAALRPHLTGAVWRGTATRHNAIHLHLYCDDPKSAEITLLNLGVRFEVGSTGGPRGREVDMLQVLEHCPDLGEPVAICLTVLDLDDVRGALRSDARGIPHGGDLAALRQVMATAEAADQGAGHP